MGTVALGSFPTGTRHTVERGCNPFLSVKKKRKTYLLVNIFSFLLETTKVIALRCSDGQKAGRGAMRERNLGTFCRKVLMGYRGGCVGSVPAHTAHPSAPAVAQGKLNTSTQPSPQNGCELLLGRFRPDTRGKFFT